MLIPTESNDSPDTARAFSEGCDARLEGRPESANPYTRHDKNHGSPYSMWRRGWRDVDFYFGARVRGRWQYRKLCAVKLPASGSLAL